MSHNLSTLQTLATSTNVTNSIFEVSHYFYQYHELYFPSVKRIPSMSQTPATYKIDMRIGRVLTEIFWGLSDANHIASGNHNYWASWHKFKVCWAFIIKPQKIPQASRFVSKQLSEKQSKPRRKGDLSYKLFYHANRDLAATRWNESMLPKISCLIFGVMIMIILMYNLEMHK